ncbi:hypothetical protein GRI40_00875 [Altererythrobacter aerius]|uniref:Uncharacterized protein n=1 Tax=Tsuneonella aeria TaxID=1837929 RepID=A0A6I4TB11_9SPHN|nr:hypothetical protein [Tsuneonella aeria]MXO73776.1 hypothetical protein [Tsuneonella aeria]
MIILPLLVAAGAAAAALPAPSPARMLPGYTEPPARWTSVDEVADQVRCADRIERVRDVAGQPRLDRTPASPERPLMIAAVDKRIDDCAVLQMHGDINDVRPIPPANPSAPLLQPAR